MLVAAYKQGMEAFDVHTHFYFDTREDFRDFNREILQKYIGHVQRKFGLDDGRRIVMKEPSLTELLPEMSEMYPNARFVVMIRDLREIIVSQARRHIRSRRANFDLLGELNRFVGLMRPLRQSSRALSGKLRYCGYKSFVSDPRVELAKVGAFLGIDVDEIDPARPVPTLRRPEDESASALDGGPVTPAHVGKLDGLTPDILKALDGYRWKVAGEIGFDPFEGLPENP